MGFLRSWFHWRQNGYDQHRERNVTVKFVVNEKGNPPGKFADAELRFHDGVLAGLTLIGVGVWERRSGGGWNVTFPARQYAVNGERRSFALLRPIDDIAAHERVRDIILEAYAQARSQRRRGITAKTERANATVRKPPTRPSTPVDRRP